MDTKEFQKMLDGQTRDINLQISELKGHFDIKSQEIERYMGALKESFEDQVKGVAEAVTMTRESLERRLDSHDKKLDSHTEMIGNLMIDMEIVKSDVGTLKSDVGTLKSDVGTLRSDMEIVKSDVGTLKSDVGVIKEAMKKKVGYEEFSSLKSKFEKTVA